MVDAYIQVLKDSKKLHFTLENFRKIYPDSNIFLVSDKGDNLAEVANKYNCKYLHAETNTGIESIGFTKEQSFEWLKRFKQSFDYAKNEYLIYLEDDVLVRGEININKSWKIAGAQVNIINKHIIDYFEKKYHHKFSTNLYGACGGAIYHVPTFINLYDNFVNMIENDFDFFYDIHKINFGYLDMFMPALFMANGIEYSFSTELTESHRNENWKTTPQPIVHGKNLFE